MYTNYLPQIEAVQRELDRIKSYQNQPATNPVQSVVPNFQEMVQQAVQAEINKLLPPKPVEQPVEQPAQQAAQPTDPRAIMIGEVNKFAQSVLEPEQIKWLSDPTIMGGLPLFFKSEKGKQAVQLLFTEYQDYVNR